MSETFETIEQVRQANIKNGYDFFEKIGSDHACMRVESYLLAGKYFISSELVESDQTNRDRLYTVRQVKPDGQVVTVGIYQEYESIKAAQDAIMALVK